MSTEPLSQLRLTRIANTLLDATAGMPEGTVGVTDRCLIETAEALCRAASLVLAVKGIADDALDRSPADTRRDLVSACRDFELGSEIAHPAAPPLITAVLAEEARP